MFQRVLTAGIEGRGGVLEGGEGLVLPEALGQVLGGFSVEVIHCQAANESQIDASEGADTGETDARRRTRGLAGWNLS